MNSFEEQNTHKLLLLVSIIVILTAFTLSLQTNSGQLSMSILPEAPHAGDPLLVSFSLNNPELNELSTDYQLFVNGKLAMEGNTVLPPKSNKNYEYLYKNPAQIGEQIVFVARSSAGGEDFEHVISYPPYPPAVLSSFVSFASFSTSVMSYMTTMSYFEDAFTDKAILNVGFIFSIVLIILLIYIELTGPRLFEKTWTIINNLRIRFERLAGVLFIIFMCMVLAQLAIVIGVV